MFFTDNCFHLRVTLADAMHSMDVPCDSRLAYSYVPFPCHAFPACVLVLSRSRFVCFHFTVSDCWLVCAYSFCLVNSSAESLFLDSDSYSDSWFRLRLVSPFTNICNCIAQFTIYMGWRWGFVPHLQSTLQPPYKCEPRDPTNSLSFPSSSLAKATASRFLGIRLLCLLAYR